MPVSLTQTEERNSLCYTAISLLVLPSLLTEFLASLGPLWINSLYYVLNFGILAILLRRFLRSSARWGLENFKNSTLIFLAGFAGYFVCNYLVSRLILWILPDFSNHNDGQLGQLFSQSFLLMTLYTVVLVPFAEELMHRAVIFGALYRRHPAAAYLVSAAVFSAVHVLGYIGKAESTVILLSFLQYLPAGLILAWCYRKSGCIFVSILLHAAINTVGVLALR